MVEKSIQVVCMVREIKFYIKMTLKLFCIAFGWMISLLGLLQLPFWMIVAVFKQPGDNYREKFLGAFKPNMKWGPVDLKISK